MVHGYRVANNPKPIEIHSPRVSSIAPAFELVVDIEHTVIAVSFIHDIRLLSHTYYIRR